MIITFVVLHYESLNDTRECIDSLKKYLIDDEVSIVVVDNGSKNGKLNTIISKYSEPNIHFIFSETNLGFARGNNLGFVYAKNILRSDVIVLCNNDLVFEQEDFISILKSEVKRTHFDVAGPKIISLIDGMNQNPVSRMFYTKKDVRKRYMKTSILYVLNTVGLDLLFKKIFAKPIQEFSIDDSQEFQLHGACMIFGTDYIKEYDGIYSGTFMYGEEDILRYQIEKNNLKLEYLDKIIVKHKEGSSTSNVLKKERIKRRFFYKHSLDSLKQLMDMMK